MTNGYEQLLRIVAPAINFYRRIARVLSSANRSEMIFYYVLPFSCDDEYT